MAQVCITHGTCYCRDGLTSKFKDEVTGDAISTYDIVDETGVKSLQTTKSTQVITYHSQTRIDGLQTRTLTNDITTSITETFKNRTDKLVNRIIDMNVRSDLLHF